MAMLGAQCSPCCLDCDCLPDEVTVTFSGLTGNVTKTGDLLSVKFEASFGADASATVACPGGKPDEGFPIESVTLTSGGIGYALLGRVAPTITASATPGSDAVFTVSLSKVDEVPPYWKVGSVSVSKGTGYVDGSNVSFSVADGDTESVAAQATLTAGGRSAPTLTASAPDGSGLAVTITYSGPVSDEWSVSKVSVTSGGTGYTDGDELTFALGDDDVEVSPAFATLNTGRVQPTVSANASFNSTAGSGESLSVTLTQTTDGNGKAVWYVSAVSVVSGGQDFAVDEIVVFIVDDGTAVSNGSGKVAAVDGNGAITAVSVTNGGSYYKPNGIVESVTISNGGAYYKYLGTPSAVTVTQAGKYWREDPSAEPYVASVTATIEQVAPSDGTGATVSAVVDSDTSSETFGQIASLTLANGGSGYLGLSYESSECDISQLNGNSFVFKRDEGACTFTKCFGLATFTGGINYPQHLGVVTYSGLSVPPAVSLIGGTPVDPDNDCNVDFFASSKNAPFACKALQFEADDIFGDGTASVVPGDPYNILSCEKLYAADEITITLTAEDFYFKVQKSCSTGKTYRWEEGFKGSSYAGTYVLQYEYTSGGVRYYTYDFPNDGDAVCEDAVLQIRISQNELWAELLNLHRLARESIADGGSFNGLAGLDCEETESGDRSFCGTYDYEKTYYSPTAVGFGFSCACDVLEGRSLPMAYVNQFPQCSFCGTETVREETGSREISFTFDSYE